MRNLKSRHEGWVLSGPDLGLVAPAGPERNGRWAGFLSCSCKRQSGPGNLWKAEENLSVFRAAGPQVSEPGRGLGAV